VVLDPPARAAFSAVNTAVTSGASFFWHSAYLLKRIAIISSSLTGKKIHSDVLVAVDVGIEVTNIKQERDAIAILNVRHTPILNQAPHFPFADTEVCGCFLGPKQPRYWCYGVAHHNLSPKDKEGHR